MLNFFILIFTSLGKKPVARQVRTSVFFPRDCVANTEVWKSGVARDQEKQNEAKNSEQIRNQSDSTAAAVITVTHVLLVALIIQNVSKMKIF